MSPRGRAISDVVAEVLLILVVLSIGAALLGYYLYQLSYYGNAQPSSFDQLAYAVPVVGLSNASGITIVFDTGPYGINLYAITVNNSPANCTIKVGPQNFTTPVLLPANELVEAECNSKAPALVTLVTNAGSYEVRVSGP